MRLKTFHIIHCWKFINFNFVTVKTFLVVDGCHLTCIISESLSTEKKQLFKVEVDLKDKITNLFNGNFIVFRSWHTRVVHYQPA